MYERFTDRARKVMQMANQEAQKLNHEYVGTEHQLLGLLKETQGVAHLVFGNLSIDKNVVRSEVEKLLTPGPEMVTMGKLPQTPRGKKVVEFAIIEARDLGHNYVGTEHVLLGLLREPDGIAGQVLQSLGMTVEKVRDSAKSLLGDSKVIEGIRADLAGAMNMNSWKLTRVQLPERNEDHETFSRDAQFVRLVAGGLLLEHFGDRCDHFEAGCACCERWKLLDQLLANPFA